MKEVLGKTPEPKERRYFESVMCPGVSPNLFIYYLTLHTNQNYGYDSDSQTMTYVSDVHILSQNAFGNIETIICFIVLLC